MKDSKMKKRAYFDRMARDFMKNYNDGTSTGVDVTVYADNTARIPHDFNGLYHCGLIDFDVIDNGTGACIFTRKSILGFC